MCIRDRSLGVERSVLAVLCDAYDEEVVGQDKNGKDDVRVVLHLHPCLLYTSLQALEPTLRELEKALGIPKDRQELKNLQAETEQEGFWNNIEHSQKGASFCRENFSYALSLCLRHQRKYETNETKNYEHCHL